MPPTNSKETNSDEAAGMGLTGWVEFKYLGQYLVAEDALPFPHAGQIGQTPESFALNHHILANRGQYDLALFVPGF
jgi:hypothetical protein